MRNRTRAREAALQILYQMDVLGTESLDGLDSILRWLLDPAETDSSVARYASELVRGCWEHRAELDARIRAVAEHWEIGRMATIDRNILRMGTFELLFGGDVPPKVAINEAIELAKLYSTADSGSFVNGILDKILSGKEQGQ